jgi:hypothetical protein
MHETMHSCHFFLLYVGNTNLAGLKAAVRFSGKLTNISSVVYNVVGVTLQYNYVVIAYIAKQSKIIFPQAGRQRLIPKHLAAIAQALFEHRLYEVILGVESPNTVQKPSPSFGKNLLGLRKR